MNKFTRPTLTFASSGSYNRQATRATKTVSDLNFDLKDMVSMRTHHLLLDFSRHNCIQPATNKHIRYVDSFENIASARRTMKSASWRRQLDLLLEPHHVWQSDFPACEKIRRNDKVKTLRYVTLYQFSSKARGLDCAVFSPTTQHGGAGNRACADAGWRARQAQLRVATGAQCAQQRDLVQVQALYAWQHARHQRVCLGERFVNWRSNCNNKPNVANTQLVCSFSSMQVL